jgi:sigma-B regulation protein RsbU (phosphoserine phosphatase)
MDILVADDAVEIRHVLSSLLKQLGHKVVTATNGEDALAILESSEISIVISDWMMPQLSGLELCKIVRERNFNRYIYFIMLTALSSQEQIVEGMQAGADDYIIKPFYKADLEVRINAGIRILQLQEQLAVQNNHLREANDKLNETLELLQGELEFAAALQKDILPKTATELSGYKFDWLFLPCHYTAGDIFNYYPVDEKHILFYQLDVAGHGAASAMLSFSLSKFISGLFETCHIATDLLKNPEAGFHDYLRHPGNILHLLNSQFVKQDDAMQYFTICIGIINTENHEIRLCRAGHPYPMIIKKDGTIRILDQKGFPVGMLEQAEFVEETFGLQQGERLFIYSDGLSEILPQSDGPLAVQAVQHLISGENDEPHGQTLERIRFIINNATQGNQLLDDISVLTVERL